MQKKFRFLPSRLPKQQVFQFQDRALAQIDRKVAKQICRVFDQAHVMRFWTPIPMLPCRPPCGWRQEKDPAFRKELQNTYQLNALCVDMGIDREELARVPNFRAFRSRAVDAVRLFDLRIGPPWWITDKDFLESAYVASQEQEKPDAELCEHLWPYWGDGCEDTPYWVAQNFFDHEHASSAGVIQQVIWSRKPSQWTNAEYRANLLLNWQAIYQPLLAYSPDYEEFGHPWDVTFPHQFQMKRVLRLLTARPKGRIIHAGPTLAAPPRGATAVARNQNYSLASG